MRIEMRVAVIGGLFTIVAAIVSSVLPDLLSYDLGETKQKNQSSEQNILSDRELNKPKDKHPTNAQSVAKKPNNKQPDTPINYALLVRGAKILSENDHLVSPPNFLSDLIDGNMDSYISMNATQLEKFTYTLKFPNPINISRIVFYHPEYRDPINYLKTVEIRVKPSIDLVWNDIKKYELPKEKGESFLKFETDFPVSEIKINPIDNWNSLGGFTHLGDISVIGKLNTKQGEPNEI